MDEAIKIGYYEKDRLVTANMMAKEEFKSVKAIEEVFQCPECGEYVTFVRRDKYKSFFRHKKEEEEKCNFRIKNEVKISLEERIGLRIYLKKENGKFQIYIGFRMIEEELMKKLEREKAVLCVQDGNNSYVQYDISRERFYVNQKTKLKVNSIQNIYKLEVRNTAYSKELKEIWGEKVSGFKDVNFFKIKNEIGEKLVENDDILIDKEYYMVATKKIVISEDIHTECIGCLEEDRVIKYREYRVYKIKISPKNRESYETIAKIFRKRFKLKLVENSDDIDNIWPPTIEIDEEEMFLPNLKGFCFKINSNYDEVLLSEFTDNKIKHERIKTNSIIYKELHKKVGLSVDNIFRVKKIYRELNRKNIIIQNNIKVFSNENETIKLGVVDRLPSNKSIVIESNRQIGICHEKVNGEIKRYEVKKSSVTIGNIRYGESLFSDDINYGNFKIEFRKNVVPKILMSNKYKELALLKGEKIKTSIEIRKILEKIPKQSMFYELLRKYVLIGKIPRKLSEELSRLNKKGIFNEK